MNIELCKFDGHCAEYSTHIEIISVVVWLFVYLVVSGGLVDSTPNYYQIKLCSFICCLAIAVPESYK